MGLLNFFSKVFGKPKQPKSENYVYSNALVSIPQYQLREESALYGNCVECLARNASLLTPVVSGEEGTKGWETTNYILGVRPNPTINSYQFLHAFSQDYFYFGMAVARMVLNSVTGNLEGIYNIPLERIVGDPVEYNGELWFQISDENGNVAYYPRSYLLICVRKGTSQNPFSRYDCSLDTTLDALDSDIKSFKKQLANAKIIRFVATPVSNSMDGPEVIRKKIDTQCAGDSQVLVAPDGATVSPVNIPSPTVAKQPAITDYEGNVYSYFGLTEKMLQNDLTDSSSHFMDYKALGGFKKDLIQELTTAIITRKSYGYGNRVTLVSPDDSTEENGIKKAQTLISSGYFKPNEIRRLIHMDPIEGGDTAITSANYSKTPSADGAGRPKGEQK